MTRIKPINLDHLGTQRPEPASSSADPVAATPRRQWLSWIAWAALVAFIAWQQFGGRIVPPKPDIDVDGLYVLMVADGDRRDITVGQGAALSSVLVEKKVVEMSGKYRRADRKDDLEVYGEPWVAMQRAATNPPQMVTAKNGRIEVRSVPDGVDAAISIIGGL